MFQQTFAWVENTHTHRHVQNTVNNDLPKKKAGTEPNSMGFCFVHSNRIDVRPTNDAISVFSWFFAFFLVLLYLFQLTVKSESLDR